MGIANQGKQKGPTRLSTTSAGTEEVSPLMSECRIGPKKAR